MWISDLGLQAGEVEASRHPEVVEAYLQEEVCLGCLLPMPPGACPQLHISRFGVMPKNNNPGKWRLITNLSSPDSLSVNDAISPPLCSLEYITADMVAKKARGSTADAFTGTVQYRESVQELE